MFYFVPSWYQQDRKWYSTTLPFYYISKNMMFDDAVNLLRMFQQSGEDNKALILNYSPHIRTFFYQQRILSETMWNLFDTIQGLTDAPVRKICLADLKWPQGVEFFYTPFLVDAYLNQEHYARINFTKTGNLFDITYYDGGQINYQLIFDDRGFVSSIIYFENNQPYYQDYLNLQGVWQFREFLTTDNHQVIINPEAQEQFAKEVYRDIEELVSEKLAQYLASVLTKDDTIVVSADVQHNHFFQKIKEEYNVILSFFGERYPMVEIERLLADLEGTPFFVVDSLNKIDKIENDVDLEQLPGYYEIPPYDTHLNLGHSQRKKELIIYVNYDNLPEDQIQYIFTTLFDLMLKHEWIDLLIGTQNQDYGREAYVRQVIEGYLALNPEYEFNLIFVEKNKMAMGADPTLSEEDEILRERLDIATIHSDVDLAKALKYVRIILDLGSPADVLTQIAGISGGIPQVNLYSSSYVKHGENGWILEDISQFTDALMYYLTDLEHWNKSLVHSVKKIEQYTRGEIVEMWKNTIKELKENEEN